MRLFTRIIFGLNTVYQVIIGIIGLLAPLTMLGLYGAAGADAQVTLLLASMRALGAFILFGGVISAIIAKNPDRYPVLLPLMATLALLTILAWVLALLMNEMTISQVGIDIAAQILIIVAALGYYGKAKRRAAPAA